MDSLLRNEFIQTVAAARTLLNENPEWEERFLDYGNRIASNIEKITNAHSKFHEWQPLFVYLNATNAKKGSRVVDMQLRYLGQNVADLKYNGSVILDTRNYSATNQRDFDCAIALNNVSWSGTEAAKFRKYFMEREPVRNNNSGKKNDEHRIESLLLTEFSKSQAQDKALRLIQPVRIGGIRFPMPTPFTASDHGEITYSGHKGGNIDILTRVGSGGRATKLCVMELKDEQKKSEPASDAMKQALIYTTFIRELVRSEAGPVWWRLFGFKGGIPARLDLLACCAMPSNENNDLSFGGMKLDVDDDTITLHYAYFEEETNRISKIISSLNSI